MNTRIGPLSDDALDAVSGGYANNGSGTEFSHNQASGALPLTGNAGNKTHGIDPAGFLISMGVIALGAFGYAQTNY